jgi:hypothetical protein
MSEVKVNKISPRTNCGTVQLGDSGDTITIPAGATITNNGTQTGFGRTGTVDWQTGSIKTATFTAVNGEGYFANTTSSAFTMNLPVGSAGAIVSVQDYNNTFDTNSLTVEPNGTEKINGGTAGDPVTLATEGQGVTFVYIDSTVGWRSVQDNQYATQGEAFISATGGTITTDGDFKIHTFTGPGTFCVSSLATTPANNEVSYIVAAGGGSGGARNPGNANGGGGGGGFRESKSGVDTYTASPIEGSTPITVTATAFPITVGAGGAGVCQTPTDQHGNDGSNSVFSTITSTGGGGGGGGGNNIPSTNGRPGGSGGGAGGGIPSGVSGGSGNTPPVSPPQGNNGGIGGNLSPNGPAAGGGGATETGESSASGTVSGRGGAGASTSITGSSVGYAGGGGGSKRGSCTAGAGSPDGSGAAGGTVPTGSDATANRGGGGGGGTATCGVAGTSGAGGSGVVIIRYKFQ